MYFGLEYSELVHQDLGPINTDSMKINIHPTRTGKFSCVCWILF